MDAKQLSHPPEWREMALKRAVRFGYGEALAFEDREPGDVKVYGSNGPFAFHSRANTLSPCIVIGRKGSYGKLQYSHKPVYCVDTTYIVDERFSDQDLRYVYYLLGTLGLDEASADSAVPGLSREKAYQTRIVLPPPAAQARIARHLDNKTARIDALIEKKQALLDRLAEKRQSLITHSVTRGLDPNVPLKDSGIDWLGQIPAHWDTGNIRRFAAMRTGHTPSRSKDTYWENCHIPWFTLADIWQLRNGRRWYLGETSEQISDIGLANSAAELLPAGTVILSRTASVGFSGVMPVAMATSQDFWNWICSDAIRPEYLLLLFRSMNQELEKSMAGSTHQTIYKDVAASLHICVPPPIEQDAIIADIKPKVEASYDLSEKIQSSIERLKEYRAALITAAVTGKTEI